MLWLKMKRTSQMSIKLVVNCSLIHSGYVHTIPESSCADTKNHVHT